MTTDHAALLQIKDSYQADTRAFLRFVEVRKVPLTIEALEEYGEFLRTSAYAAQTVNKRLTGAKKVLRRVFLQSDESRDVLAAFDFERRLKDIRKLTLNTKEVPEEKLLSADEVRRLLDHHETPARLRLIVRTFSVTGLRVSELVNIRVTDVRQEAGHFSVRIRGKGGKERRIMLPIDLVRQIHETFGGKVWLFETTESTRYKRENVSRDITAIGHRVLGKRISAHTLRHTFATHLIKTGKTVKAVSLYIGHSTTAITQDMYVHDSLELADIIGSM